MKLKRRWLVSLAVFTAVCGFNQIIDVKANTEPDLAIENNYTEIPTSVTLPIYEVTDFGETNQDNPMNLEATVPLEGSHSIPFLEISDGKYGTNKGATYTWSAPNGESDEGYFDTDDQKPHYKTSGNEIDGFYVYLTSFTPVVHFVDSADGKEISKSSDGIRILIASDGSGDYDLRNITAAELPDGYALDKVQNSYHIGDSLDDATVYISKYDPDEYNYVHFVINSHIKGTQSEDLVKSIELHVPYDTENGLTDYLKDINLTRNPEFNPMWSQTKGEIFVDNGIEQASTSTASTDIMLLLSQITTDGLTISRGNHYVFDIYYDDYNDDPENGGKLIAYDVAIPSNLDSTVVSPVHAEGKLGETLELNIPEVEGYKADKDTILATVNPDGTITANDKVNYSKISTGNSNNGSSSQSNIDISDVNLHVATIDGNKTYLADQKKVENGKTYYRVGVGRWLNADDVYIYEDFHGYVRTYSNSYKSLINSNKETIKNRALARASDWFSDRSAIFDGDKYYRVATNEWVKANDVFEYRINQTTINVPAQTVLYNEYGKSMRMVTKETSLKTDRIAQINGKEYYRVATNEYVLVTDILGN